MKVGDRNSHENLQAEVERLRTELTRRERDTKNQQRENGRQQRQIDGLQGQIERQKREIEQLRGQLAAARRAGFRQAAPFAKDRPQGRGRRPGRRAGTQYGRKACRPRPARVDQTLEAPVPTACPDCSGSVEVTHVASQYQEEIPEVRPIVRRFDIEVGRCSQCRRRVQGRHALQTSDALGAAGAQLGPGVVALVGCGREPGCPGPPAQIRTCALTHTAPTLGGGRQTACRAKGAEPARGANRAPRGASHQSALSVSSVTAAARF